MDMSGRLSFSWKHESSENHMDLNIENMGFVTIARFCFLDPGHGWDVATSSYATAQ